MDTFYLFFPLCMFTFPIVSSFCLLDFFGLLFELFVLPLVKWNAMEIFFFSNAWRMKKRARARCCHRAPERDKEHLTVLVQSTTESRPKMSDISPFNVPLSILFMTSDIKSVVFVESHMHSRDMTKNRATAKKGSFNINFISGWEWEWLKGRELLIELHMQSTKRIN